MSTATVLLGNYSKTRFYIFVGTTQELYKILEV
jgi:hypothetical protein